MVLHGELSPTTANHNFEQQVRNANIEKSSVCQRRALNPGLKAGARRAIRSRPAATWRPRQREPAARPAP